MWQKLNDLLLATVSLILLLLLLLSRGKKKKESLRIVSRFHGGQERIYELSQFFQYIVDFFAKETKSQRGALYLYSREESKLRRVASQGIPTGEISHPLPEEAAAFALTLPQTLLPLSSSPGSSAFRDAAANPLKKETFTHLLVLAKRNLLLGIVALGNPQERIPAETMKPLLETASHSLENFYLYQSAITDETTNLYNKRFLQRSLQAEIRRASRYGQPCSLLAFDIDDFKKINDQFGHPQGDQILKEIAERLQECLRAGIDIPSRTGGEEFHVILPETNREGGRKTGERILEKIRNHPFSGIPSGNRVTLSLGIAAYPEDAENEAALQSLADQALYQAKSLGKDCLCLANELNSSPKNPVEQENRL